MNLSSVESKIQEFTTKQVEILEMQIKSKEVADKLIAEFKAKSEALQKEYQDQINSVEQPTKNALEKYRAELKAWLGVTDGEQMNVLQLAMVFMKLTKHD